MERAVLTRHFLPDAEFRTWFNAFLLDLARRTVGNPLAPAHVGDRSDSKIAQLDDLGRYWCYREVEIGVAEADPRRTVGKRQRRTSTQPAA